MRDTNNNNNILEIIHIDLQFFLKIHCIAKYMVKII